MRKIEFRAWDKEKKRMVYKSLYDRNWYYTPVNDHNGCNTAYECATHKENHHSEPMQFTGLNDKNGKDIYDGDIVNFIFFTNVFPVRRVVFYDNEAGRFSTAQEDDAEGEYLGNPDCEIIGNIHENGDLLKPNSGKG